uniref:FP protein C-terminal domain-containing protein n=1 Tax=Heliothis virescens TaxID=7102 RepID=A0A2A4IW47_HELVI
MNRGNKRPATRSPSPPSPLCDKDEIRSIIQEIIKSEFKVMLTQFNENMINTINKELEPVRDEMKEIVKSMFFINAKFDEIEKRQQTCNDTVLKLELENEELKKTIGDLQVRINIIEQQSRSNNLEIQCMPENKNENLYDIITKLANVVNCDIKEKDILHCSRIAKSNPSSTRPRSIIVQLASPRLRDVLLASTIKYNKNNPQEKLNSAHLGISGHTSPVYIMEHLSPANKALHAAARIKAKEKDYKYVWVRNGKVFVRKTDGSEYLLIKNMNSLSKII